jgi:hypothetical protein
MKEVGATSHGGICIVCFIYFCSVFVMYFHSEHFSGISISGISLSGSDLDVVRLEVALEIEDLELIGLGKSKELTERGIGLDDLLHHKSVLLGVAADASGHLRAADLSSLGEAEEGTESIRDGGRLGEDGILLGLVLSIHNGGLAPATLLSLLELARDLLLELLHIRVKRAEGGAELVHALHDSVELGDDVHVLLSGGSRGGGLDSLGGDRGGGNRGRSGNSNGGSDGRGGGRGGGGGGLAAGFLSDLGGRRHFLYWYPRKFMLSPNAQRCQSILIPTREIIRKYYSCARFSY